MYQRKPTVSIYTQSYDLAEPYIIEHLESIKNQTYKNFICYIYDNGSGQAVKDIISSYAAADARFKVVLIEKSDKSIAWPYAFPQILNDSNGQGYFTRIDADDALELDALAKLVAFAERNALDMTVAGAHFIDAQSGNLIGDRCIEKNIIVEGEEYGQIFPQTYQLMRTHWLKLYKMDVIKSINTSTIEILPYGSDTVFVRRSILHSNRIGILSECLYRYHVYGNDNKPYNAKCDRLYAPEKLFQNDIIFLINKCGYVSRTNLIFLLNVLLGETRDSFRLIKQGIYGENAIELVHSIACTKWFRQAVRTVGNKNACSEIATWLLGQDIFADDKTMKQAAEILAALALYPEGLPGSDTSKELLLLLNIQHFWEYAESKDDLEKLIALKMHKIPLLKSCTFFFATNCLKLMNFILMQDYADAIKWIVEKLEKKEQFFLDNWEIDLIRLGFNLSALAEDAEHFVWFKGKEIVYLSQRDEKAAAKEIVEWKDIFPKGFFEFE